MVVCCKVFLKCYCFLRLCNYFHVYSEVKVYFRTQTNIRWMWAVQAKFTGRSTYYNSILKSLHYKIYSVSQVIFPLSFSIISNQKNYCFIIRSISEIDLWLWSIRIKQLSVLKQLWRLLLCNKKISHKLTVEWKNISYIRKGNVRIQYIWYLCPKIQILCLSLPPQLIWIFTQTTLGYAAPTSMCVFDACFSPLYAVVPPTSHNVTSVSLQQI